MAQSSSAAPFATTLSAPSGLALPALSPARAVLFGALTVGVLDGLDAVLFFGARGVPATRIFQAIASGLLGPASFRGGTATALLGVALHFVIALGIVAVYHAASRRWTALARHPLAFGPLYGLAAYAVMNGIVLPLSAVAGGGPRPLPVLVNGLLIHMIGVGLPAALFARAALRPTLH
jgi:hypothetical protein